jgi:thymidylate synthase
MNNIDKKYQELLQDILDNGFIKETRNGGTISVFGRQIRHKMSEGFPLLTTKKMSWKTMVTELLWFLRGDTNIKYLVDNGCHIWDGDAYKNYLKEHLPENGTLTMEEFIGLIKQNENPIYHELGELGPIYGKQWRSWERNSTRDEKIVNPGVYKVYVDQIQNLINDLKTNPDSRRLMVNAWNVGELDQMVLPPCHYGFQVYTRQLTFDERWSLYSDKPYDGNGLGMINTLDYLDNKNIPTRTISLMWNQRSVDVPLGLPFNIASYGLLLEIIAKQVNMIPDELIGNLGDCHIYLNQIDGVIEQIGRDLTDEERYKKWFNNNYETGMENFFDPNKLPDFDNPYYEPTPKRTREPYKLPTVKILDSQVDDIAHYEIDDFVLENYKSHPKISFPLSN